MIISITKIYDSFFKYWLYKPTTIDIVVHKKKKKRITVIYVNAVSTTPRSYIFMKRTV